jgi:thiosulfate/3-mercaptopyruvate sulfurtransferase
MFLQGHVPGAVNLPAFFLKGPQGPPETSLFVATLGKLGIGPDTHVIAYDDGASPAAARLYWVLSYLGHPAISIMDGGFRKWQVEGRPVDVGPGKRAEAHYEVRAVATSELASLEDVARSVDNDEAVIVDTRGPSEFGGWQMTAARNGHIPGAVNVEWSQNLERTDDGVYKLRSDQALRALYAEQGVTPDKRVIVHCQSGDRASLTYVVLKKLGYPRVAHYARGWSEWGNRSDTSVAEE